MSWLETCITNLTYRSNLPDGKRIRLDEIIEAFKKDMEPKRSVELMDELQMILNTPVNKHVNEELTQAARKGFNSAMAGETGESVEQVQKEIRQIVPRDPSSPGMLTFKLKFEGLLPFDPVKWLGVPILQDGHIVAHITKVTPHPIEESSICELVVEIG